SLTSAAAEPAPAATRPTIRATASVRIGAFDSGPALLVHRELFLDPQREVARERRRLVLAAVEVDRRRRVDAGGVALGLVSLDLGLGGRVVGLEALEVEADLLGVAQDVVLAVLGRAREQDLVHLVELALRLRRQRRLRRAHR